MDDREIHRGPDPRYGMAITFMFFVAIVAGLFFLFKLFNYGG